MSNLRKKGREINEDGVITDFPACFLWHLHPRRMTQAEEHLKLPELQSCCSPHGLGMKKSSAPEKEQALAVEGKMPPQQH
jgi:hypothetical protein